MMEASAPVLKDLTVTDLCCYLEEAGVHEDVTRSFIQNRIDSLGFLSLTDDELKELIPVVGDRISVRRIKEKFAIERRPQQQEQVAACVTLNS